jgi:hypothetical protein
LQQGSLVALAVISPGRFQVFLGTIVYNGLDVAESAKADEGTIQLRISFFDAEIELMAFRCQAISVDQSTLTVLVDNKIMFEAVDSFFRILKDVHPPPSTSLIWCHTLEILSRCRLDLRDTRAFRSSKYNLQCLARSGNIISGLDVNNATSVAITRQELIPSSTLDPSQVDAVIGALSREVSLIQGYVPDLPAKLTSDYRVVSPPGTGKVRTTSTWEISLFLV